MRIRNNHRRILVEGASKMSCKCKDCDKQSLSPSLVISAGITGIMYLVYLDFGRGDTLGTQLKERLDTTIGIGYVPCLTTWDSFVNQVIGWIIP